jgi:hypothetical protein
LKDALPEHILRQIEEEREAERKEQERQEWERNLCKVGGAGGRGLQLIDFFPPAQFRLFCRHPVSRELSEKRLEVHKDITLRETVAEAHRVGKTFFDTIHERLTTFTNKCI